MNHFSFSKTPVVFLIIVLSGACNPVIPHLPVNTTFEQVKTAEAALPVTGQTIPAELSTVDDQTKPLIKSVYPNCTEIGQTRISPVDGMTLNCVPSGEFFMGASKGDPLAKDNEKPQHKVFLAAFWIDRTEISNADLSRCMAADACHPKYYEVSALTYTPYAVHPDFQNYPALIYAVEDAETYCAWAGRRLPTEAEWEKAARGTDERIYPWGNELDCDLANYYGCNNAPANDANGPRCGYSGFCRTNQVDAFPTSASPYGVLNMAGNVWEWVGDWYAADYYTSSAYANRGGPASGDYKIRKGGGSNSISADLRISSRASGKANHYFDGQMGFRCAMNAGGK